MSSTPDYLLPDVSLTNRCSAELVRALASDQYVAEAARVSTLAEVSSLAAQERDNGGLIRRLVNDKHGSPFEHGLLTFRVNATLDVMTEHLRHRAGVSYNGESGRYKTFEPRFYTPGPRRPLTQTGKAMDYDMQPGNEGQRALVEGEFQRITREAWASYTDMLNAGIAREVARKVLPVNLFTTYYVTFNPRSLMHFIALRTTSDMSRPMFEIEQVALDYERELARLMPITYAAFAKTGVAP